MNIPNKDKMILSVLNDGDKVDDLMSTLNNAGYEAKDISIIVKGKEYKNNLI